MTDRGRKWLKSSYYWIAVVTMLLAVLVACGGSSASTEAPEATATLSATASPSPTTLPATATTTPAFIASSEGTPSATSSPVPSTPAIQPSPDSDGASAPVVSEDLPDDPTELMMATLDRGLAVVAQKMADSGNKSYIPVVLEFLRFLRQDEARISAISSINKLLEGPDTLVIPPERTNWHWWIEWLGNHPEIQPPDGFDGWKGQLYSLLVPGIGAFLYDGVKTEIRLEEVVWGGVRTDGIPDLINPPVVSPVEATYLEPSD